MKYIIHNKHGHCSCYVANSQSLQCKHMISYKEYFHLSLFRKCWYQRNKITNLSYVGSYVNPRLYNFIPEIEEVELFSISNNEDMYDEIIIDEIETNQLYRDGLDLKENNISKNNISHSSLMTSTICYLIIRKMMFNYQL